MNALSGLILVTLATAQPVDISPGNCPLIPTITVVGRGEAKAATTQATVSIGVVSNATEAAQAMELNNKRSREVYKVLLGAGIAKDDIQTSAVTVQPEYRNLTRGDGLSEVVGYRVSNQVRVAVRQVAALGKVLDAAVAGGANQMRGITFSVAEPDRFLDDARKKAMADARRKAALYADAAGVTLGEVVRIQEEGTEQPEPRPMLFMGSARSTESTAPVSHGEQTFRATVTVTYRIAGKK